MNCKKCKYKLSTDSAYCPNCGALVIKSKKSSKNKTIGLVLLTLCIIGMVLTIGIIKLKKSNEIEITNPPNVTITPEDEKKKVEVPANEESEHLVLTAENIVIIKELCTNIIKDYVYAVNTGNPSVLDKYLVYNSDYYNELRKTIPTNYDKGITLNALSIEVTDIVKNDENSFRASIVTEYEIDNQEGLRYQKETLDYIIEPRNENIFLINGYKNYQLLDKYVIQSYEY